MAPPYPLVNGFRYDFSCVKMSVNALPFGGVRAINYKHSVEPGKLRGNRAQVVGVTRGEYNAEGSIEIYKDEYADLIRALAPPGGTRGYFETFFNVTVNYQESPTSPVICDELVGVRLISSENGHSEGGDALFVRCDLLIMYLLENKLSPLGKDQLLR